MMLSCGTCSSLPFQNDRWLPRMGRASMTQSTSNCHVTVSTIHKLTRRRMSKSKHESATCSRTNLHGLSADHVAPLLRAGVRRTIPVGSSPSMQGVISNKTVRNGENLAKLMWCQATSSSFVRLSVLTNRSPRSKATRASLGPRSVAKARGGFRSKTVNANRHLATKLFRNGFLHKQLPHRWQIRSRPLSVLSRGKAGTSLALMHKCL